MDFAYSVEWLIDNAENLTEENRQELLNLIKNLHDQGSDWEAFYENPTQDSSGMLNHNVNIAQALKSAAVYYRYSKNETLHDLSLSRMTNLDKAYGLPTGMYNGDEHLPTPATRHPSRGIELCGVVEAMFSYNVMYSQFGDVEFADRAEKIAYNALPATWGSPIGGDMWAH